MEDEYSLTSKRDRRRQSLSQRLYQMTELFEQEKDIHYREMLRVIQDDLYMLLVGKNEEFLEELADVEEARDEQLVGLYLWRNYQLDCVEKEYERDVEAANEEHRQMTEMVKGRLMNRLEAQRKRLSEDKMLLDIANDHSLFLSGSLGQGVVSGAAGIPGSPNGIAGAGERRTRRRKGDMEDPSGLSGNEGGSSATGTRRRAAIQSDIDGFSDMDKVLKEKETRSQKGGAYQQVKSLKPEEASEDIMLIRSGVKRARGMM